MVVYPFSSQAYPVLDHLFSLLIYLGSFKLTLHCLPPGRGISLPNFRQPMNVLKKFKKIKTSMNIQRRVTATDLLHARFRIAGNTVCTLVAIDILFCLHQTCTMLEYVRVAIVMVHATSVAMKINEQLATLTDRHCQRAHQSCLFHSLMR